MGRYKEYVKNGFRTEKRNGVVVLKIPMFEQHGFEKHCFTTRIGGVSKNEFASLNLSKTRENNTANKEENYRRTCGVIGVEYGSLVLVNYSHGNGVHFACREDKGKGFSREADFAPCDGMVTNDPDVTAVTLHADCVPVFFADAKQRVAGVAHAGWKGVYHNITANMVQSMRDGCGSDPADVLVGIGPHIMAECFEVQEDVAGPFVEQFGAEAVHKQDGGMFVDLQYALLKQLEECGISPEHVTCANLCTYSNEEMFYSHRRDKGKTGAMGSFITV